MKIFKTVEEAKIAYMIAANKEFNENVSATKNKAHNHLSDKSIKSKVRRLERLKKY